MKKLKQIILNLSPTDLIVVVFYSFLIVLNIIFHNRISASFTLILYNFLFITLVVTLAQLDKIKSTTFIQQMRWWYVAPLIFLTFKEMYFLVRPIHHVDYDDILIAIDRFTFGCDPTIELYKIANPFLTEILQVAYGTFFILPIILGVDLMLKKRFTDLNFSLFVVVLGFFLSYIGYLLVPAVGPRFTLHDFHLTDAELPGLVLTDIVRFIVNSGESIFEGMQNPIELVQRDVFPSGHAQMTMLIMYLSVKLKTKTRYFLIPDGILLIIGTVYLRYHYVIDLFGAVVFLMITLWLGRRLYNRWMGITGGEKFEYP
ncbi:MAG: hypothetical protein A2V66_09120 [Ignavibacteria bacterium RBG_13_36_8]|nr:MAG: hypothetical protein A2V66_09120 [Ignavibacteria bacterium RBG_13_36_8]